MHLLSNRKKTRYATLRLGLLICCLSINASGLMAQDNEGDPQPFAELPKNPDILTGCGFNPTTGETTCTQEILPFDADRQEALIQASLNPNRTVILGANGITQIIAIFDDDGMEGFNDPALGAQRQAAFEFAMQIWADALSINGTVVVITKFENLGFDPNFGGTLAQAFAPPFQSKAEVQELPLGEVLYPTALAIHVSGRDPNGPLPEINLEFNADVDEPGNPGWYYGLDANPPFGTFDFVSTVLHEIGHGLGFFSSADPFGNGSFGFPHFGNGFFQILPTIYDVFLIDGADQPVIDQPPSPALVTGNNVFWAGDQGNLAFQEDFGGTGNIPLYAPFFFSSGSSISHLDEFTFNRIEFEMMTPFASGAIHVPDPVILGMFADMGYDGTGSTPPTGGDLVDDHPNFPPACTDIGEIDTLINEDNPKVVTPGTLEVGGDHDAFCFELSAGMTYLIEVELRGLPRSQLRLYNTNGVDVLEESDDSFFFGGFFGNANLGSSIEFAPEKDGIYFAQIRAFTASQRGKYEFNISLAGATEPTGTGNFATARATPVRGMVPLLVNLQGGAPNDVEISSSEWDFGDGDGDFGNSVSHVFTLPGIYTARFTVRDKLGVESQATVVIEVLAEPNELPTVSASASTTSGQAPLTVQFDGFGTDSDGQIVRYDWSFGDGDSGTGQSIEHTYTSDGTFNAVLTVTDDAGGTATDIVSVIVGDALAANPGNPTGQPVPAAPAAMCGATNALTYSLALLGMGGIGLLRRRW